MTKVSKRQTAEEVFNERKAEAETLLKTLITKIEADGKGENINWGHAGSMGHVIEELESINEFLGN